MEAGRHLQVVSIVVAQYGLAKTETLRMPIQAHYLSMAEYRRAGTAEGSPRVLRIVELIVAVACLQSRVSGGGQLRPGGAGEEHHFAARHSQRRLAAAGTRAATRPRGSSNHTNAEPGRGLEHRPGRLSRALVGYLAGGLLIGFLGGTRHAPTCRTFAAALKTEPCW